ncbi:MAG: hypothetical protein HXX12_06655 [Geothrix sp.]|uniref:hypothetical protein n=1 Tax=Geothrix sp. TaxID=1962974 RepID=UPI00184F7BAE|nr:hypothetical protein [Geothrix sp.]NWJ40636.1 hypothetical protein [Geothrix sp.]WIL21355.1 MAG: hypothetical protein QOZ81_000614 [Geothrix sp.]
MFVLRRLPAFIALVMLGALSLRLGLAFLLVVPLTMVLLVLLFISKRVLQTSLGAVLWGGCLAWLGMAWLRVGERLAVGLPWTRLALIFGGVTLFTAWAAWLLRAPQAAAEPRPPEPAS